MISTKNSDDILEAFRMTLSRSRPSELCHLKRILSKTSTLRNVFNARINRETKFFLFLLRELTKKILSAKNVSFDARIGDETRRDAERRRAGNPSNPFHGFTAGAASSKSRLVKESELTMNLRRWRAPMDLLRSTSAERRKRT